MTLLSDPHTDFTGLECGATIVRSDLDAGKLMLARTLAQVRFVDDYDFSLPLAFLDFDILVNRPLAWLFSRPFDVGVTVRNKRTMPVNGGVIFANNRNPTAVRRFFRQFADLYQARYADEGAWWGDQRALDDVVPTAGMNVAGERSFNKDGIDYLVLPGSRFNYSPHWLRGTLGLPRRSKYVLHFKNAARKEFIEPFFAVHMDTEVGSWPLRLLRAYRSVG